MIIWKRIRSADLEIYHTSDVSYIDCTNNFHYGYNQMIFV